MRRHGCFAFYFETGISQLPGLTLKSLSRPFPPLWGRNPRIVRARQMPGHRVSLISRLSASRDSQASSSKPVHSLCPALLISHCPFHFTCSFREPWTPLRPLPPEAVLASAHLLAHTSLLSLSSFGVSLTGSRLASNLLSDQGCLRVPDPPASSSQVLGSQACATTNNSCLLSFPM